SSPATWRGRCSGSSVSCARVGLTSPPRRRRWPTTVHRNCPRSTGSIWSPPCPTPDRRERPMPDPPPAEVLRLLFGAAAKGDTVPGPHPADDLEQITVWALGQLPAAEETALVEHLARCAPCRRTVGALVRAGVLEFASETSPERQNGRTPA